ncbi:MAG TPA: tetratricopeptide repeat protein [Polyangiaceae bacterium]|jgi:hypothetical protein|nr:MAG: hypothetical protein BWY17_00337 [Deltaproteobacteria bacterium ADurb.Bin207]HNS98826.1 tetratricopeptide repeat protein [Polyangiaceae bacterium]HNZ22174.1 tetratricopeptide repeat protein [Polyangiaceae bacterium]HOD21330.1 tetratricopeptide repeat protein [Polyangiaceae bacterium]HOE46998.1 tetratricopeptide repeat protein [Polyangiaceae bacterium]
MGLRLHPLVFFLLVSTSAWAQTDSDRATARLLAEEGIALQQQGKYEEALDKLTRAQQIFNAPTHLLLIAQCQVAVGKLVEGAETYRQLLRKPLTEQAPQAFVRAKETAARELAELEPRIPKIRILIHPDGIEQLHIRIDETAVPAAIVGIDRVENPGKHIIQVSAPGFQTAQVQFQLQESQILPVEVTLEADTPSKPAPAPTTQVPHSYTVASTPEANAPSSHSTDLLMSIRLQWTAPNGELGETHFNGSWIDPGAVRDSFHAGGGLELQADLLFGNWAVGLLFGVDDHGQPSGSHEAVKSLYPTIESVQTTKSFSAFGGISGQWHSCQRCLGFVGETAIIMRQMVQTFEIQPQSGPPDPCSLSWERDVPTVRLLAGLQIPVGSDFFVTPYLSFAGGSTSVTRLEPSDDAPRCPSNKIESSETTGGSITFFSVGVAGTYALALD